MEDKLNSEIRQALDSRNLTLANKLSARFLEEVYGEKAIRNWALRDFYAQRVKDKAQSPFDKNLARLFELREEEVEGYHSMRYESPYFKTQEVEKLDDLYEEFRSKTSESKAMSRFLKMIKTAIEDI